jgi:integrase/recombinase XerC
MVLLAGHGGLRVSEIVALTWGDVEGGVIQVKNGKGGKGRDVPMSNALKQALDALPRAHDKVMPFTTVTARARLKDLCKRAGVEYSYKGTGGMHRLRHSAGFRFYRDTRSLIHTAKFLGHASTETAKIYAAKNDSLVADTLANW